MTARIGIDARKLHDFGIGTYIRNLLKQLARIDQVTEYVLLCRPGDLAVVNELGMNFRAVPEGSGHYSVREQVHIPIALHRERVHLFHEPHYVLPPLAQCKTIVTIHDVIHLLFPQYLSGRLAHAYARACLWAAAKRAESSSSIVAGSIASTCAISGMTSFQKKRSPSASGGASGVGKANSSRKKRACSRGEPECTI